MLKSKLKKSGALAMACAVAVTGVIATTAPAFAAEVGTGTTPVTYDNRKVIPEVDGQYGFIIPTAISFTQDTTEANADVEMIGINGYNLSDWTTLEVGVKVTSAGTWTLQGQGDASGNSAKYTTTYAGFSAEQADITGLQLTKDANKIEATANLGDTSLAKKKGQYTDTITYTFDETTNVLR